MSNWCPRPVGKVCDRSLHSLTARSVSEVCLRGLYAWFVPGLYVVAQKMFFPLFAVAQKKLSKLGVVLTFFLLL